MPHPDPLNELTQQDAASFEQGYYAMPHRPSPPMAPQRRLASPLHMLWTLPLAAVLALPVLGIGWFMLCGVFGCSGGGWGRADSFNWISWVACFVIGGLFALAVGAVPWSHRADHRAYAAVAAGTLTTIPPIVLFYLEAYP